MGEVERWLVEKEKDKEGRVEDATTTNESSSTSLGRYRERNEGWKERRIEAKPLFV